MITEDVPASLNEGVCLWAGSFGTSEPAFRDAVSGTPLALYRNAETVDTEWGRVVTDRAGSNGGVTMLAPPALRLAWPVTFGAAFVLRGQGQDDYAQIAGVNPNGSDASPYASYVLQVDPDGSIYFKANDGGRYVRADQVSVPVGGLEIGALTTLLCTCDGQGVALYLNGEEVGSYGIRYADPTYGTEATYGLGAQVGTARATDADYLHGVVWSRALTADDVAFYDTHAREEPPPPSESTPPPEVQGHAHAGSAYVTKPTVRRLRGSAKQELKYHAR